ncbi:MAG TPA: acyl-CoA dehydrogenase family protein [Spirosoma sp.]|nr:acyl-CoA dehydrogenase family protein [Spirosoma sp.]
MGKNVPRPQRPSFDFSDEYHLFRQTVRQFIETEVVAHTNEWETNRRIPVTIFWRMVEFLFPRGY